MKKLNMKLSTMLIMVVTEISILVLFVDLTGISGTLKYFLLYFILLLSFFGISLWLKRNWICYLPTILLITFSFVGIILLLIFSSSGDSFGWALTVILAIIAIILSGISYLSAKLFISYAIQNEDVHLIEEFKDQIETIAISVGIITWLRFVLMVFKESRDFIYILIIILAISFFMVLGTSVLVLILYVFDKIGKKIAWIGLLLFLIYIPVSYLVKDEMIRFFVWIGLSNWLIFGTLLMIGFRKRKKVRPRDIHEEGDYYD